MNKCYGCKQILSAESKNQAKKPEGFFQNYGNVFLCNDGYGWCDHDTMHITHWLNQSISWAKRGKEREKISSI